MSTLTEVPPSMQPLDPAETDRRAPLWYGLCFAAFQVAVLALCLFAASHSWFLTHDDYPLLRSSLGYSLRLRNANCDVVLYGDSTALTDLDPAVIQARTGLTACNIAEFVSVHWIVSSFYPLDQYLAHNAPPKFLVTQWSPFEFHPKTAPMVNYQAEGYEYALLYWRTWGFLKGSIEHPMWPINFSLWSANRMIADLNSRFLSTDHDARWARESVPRDARNGIWHDWVPAETSCGPRALKTQPTDLPRDQEKIDIARFKAHYAAAGMRVIVDVSPVADCRPDRGELKEATQGLSDNQLEFLPIRLFNTGDVHMVPEGSTYVSNRVADQILAMMRQNDEAKRDASSGGTRTP